MKKLSLKNAENMLSRKEMKMISGGYYSDTAKGYKCCVGTNCSECRSYTPGQGIPSCSSGTVTSCTPS